MPEPMRPVPFLDADAIRAGVSIDDMLDAVEAAFRDVASGRDRSPLRSRVELPNGDLLIMPGVRDGAAGVSVKLVTVTPANASRGLPTIHALVAWFDADTGRPLALIDGETLTAMRTGAASGVATRLLARTDASTLAIIGAGGQAEWQLRAVLAARPIRRARSSTRATRPRARRSPARMAEVTGIEVVAADTAEAAIRGADVICCATTSSEPVFDAAWVAPGAHVNGIGAYRLGMVELPPELMARAELVAVDSRAAAMAEAGDVVAAIERGLVRGRRPGRDRQRRPGLGRHATRRRDHRLQVGRAGRPGRRRGRAHHRSSPRWRSRRVTSARAARRDTARRTRRARAIRRRSRRGPAAGAACAGRCTSASSSGRGPGDWSRVERRDGLGDGCRSTASRVTTIGAGFGGGGAGGRTSPTWPPPGPSGVAGGGVGAAVGAGVVTGVGTGVAPGVAPGAGVGVGVGVAVGIGVGEGAGVEGGGGAVIATPA